MACLHHPNRTACIQPAAVPIRTDKQSHADMSLIGNLQQTFLHATQRPGFRWRSSDCAVKLPRSTAVLAGRRDQFPETVATICLEEVQTDWKIAAFQTTILTILLKRREVTGDATVLYYPDPSDLRHLAYLYIIWTWWSCLQISGSHKSLAFMRM